MGGVHLRYPAGRLDRYGLTYPHRRIPTVTEHVLLIRRILTVTLSLPNGSDLGWLHHTIFEEVRSRLIGWSEHSPLRQGCTDVPT